MTGEILLLCGTAAAIGSVHTLCGPDHYLPFIVLGRARHWSRTRLIAITSLCGIGHVLSSVVIGFIGIACGIALTRIRALEGMRGNFTAWLLIGFGLAYFVWGLHRAWRRRPHSHRHDHADGAAHEHRHAHTHGHTHPHRTDAGNLTPWVLFIVFVFGPCEPLIPLVMYPAATGNMLGVVLVTAVFGAATLGMMLTVVLLASYGLSFARFGNAERYVHAIAGATICGSGLAIRFLGL